MKSVTECIPHRPPFLFVDSIESLSETSITALRAVRADEFYFTGHYPERPIMPGVLLCEAMLQAGAILMSQGIGIGDGEIPVVTRVENLKLKNMVSPGEQLVIDVELKEKVSNVCFFKGKVRVNGKIAAIAEFACAIVKEG